MDRNDLIQMSMIIAMVVWSIIHKMFLTAYINDITAQQIGLVILIAPMFLLEVVTRLVSSQYTYIRAIVRPDNYVLRFYIKERKLFPGELYNTMIIRCGWSVKTKHHGKVDFIRIIYRGVWEKRIIPCAGRCRLYDYEVPHRGVDQVILYEMMQEFLDVDHFSEIPTFYLKDATGDYKEFMKPPLDQIPKEEVPAKPPEAQAPEMTVEVGETE